MTDPIADMLTRIRNASAAKKHEVEIPMSKIKLAIAQILQKEGWVSKVEVVSGSGKKNQTANFDVIKIVLKYKKSGRPAVTSLRRISKPGLRIYVGKEKLPKVLNNFGIAVVSTPRGLMTNKEARKNGLGGEVLCEIF
jgi:small subunit ribosomal protein S8